MSNNDQKDKAISDASKAPFQGAQLHCMGYFPINLLERRETYEKTLDLFEISPEFGDNTSILNRPTHVFRSSPETFEQLRQKALEDENFTRVEIVENWSDLGFPCYFYANHKSGEEVFYDGIIFRITSNITDKEFHLQDSVSLMGYPPHPSSILSLNGALKKINNDLPFSVYTFRLFYTALKTNWNLLKVEAYGEPSMQLPLIDPNLVTVTALKYAEYGGRFYLYIGDHEKTLQLIAHDLYQSNEIENWKKYISQKTEKAEACLQQASATFTALSKSFWHLRYKLSTWSKAKQDFIYLLQESPSLYRYELLLNSYRGIAEKNLSSINGMRQIFISKDTWDNRAAISHWEQYFFKGEIKDNKIINIAEEPVSPGYTNNIDSLESSIEVLKKAVNKSFDLTKDVFASAQTEFSAYSIWFAILAIVVSSGLEGISFFNSSEPKYSDQQENQLRLNIDPSPRSSPITSSSIDETLLLFETSENVVRIFNRDGQILMNLYNKQSKVTRMNGVSVDVEQLSEGVRYKSPQYNVVVEVFNTPILLIDNKVNR